MITDTHFPAISPAMARDRFLLRDETWDNRFRPDFDQFIISSFEYARPVIKLPVPTGRTGNHALFLVTGGEVAIRIGHRAYTLTSPELAIVPAMQIFSIETIQENTTGYMCFVSPERLRTAVGPASFDFLKLTSQPVVSLTSPQTDYIANLLGRLSAEYYTHGSTRTDLIGPYLLTLMTEINQAYLGSVPPRISAGDQLVQRFIDVLPQRIRQSRAVTAYADWLNVTPNHLNKVLKARTGRSPSVWIDEHIVLEAKVLLFQSGLTVGQIAAELGFDDQSTFGKLFRKYVHLSPTAFRARHSQQND
ncbi:helix-turn-helix domain-containing protein [Spirosoma sordidisoli]|uniref:AraC family transcriptional regulator n=1 Tax=Spirosoma sordidisoli TaxID=2502893 RepID=A0A4Q2UX02_9BACT|nr:helix-turn-helix domain-containing protein [Spirosoma sordidisoli]RYC71539.1 AraC family transcriptional regulator [Spirosoma sordidisoli]